MCHAIALLGRLNLFHSLAEVYDSCPTNFPPYIITTCCAFQGRVCDRVALTPKKEGYGLALHVKQCCTESGPTQTPESQ